MMRKKISEISLRLKENKRLFRIFLLAICALNFYKKMFGKTKRNKGFVGLILLTIILFAGGFYVGSHPEWLSRKDIEYYNQGVEQYPIFRAAQKSFYQVTLLSTDDRLKSLALYNWGTMIGEMALDEKFSLMDRIKIAQMAIELLEKAVRLDPSLEEAKYNLDFLKALQTELLQELQAQAGQPEQQPAEGTQPGKGRGERGY